MMMAEKTCDEKLSDAVRNYPEIYDRASPYFKDKEKRRIAWENIALEIGMEGGGAASERAFINLRKRYNKLRNRIKKERRSGLWTDEDLQVVGGRLEYFQWIKPYLKARRGRSEMMVADGDLSGSDESSREGDYLDDQMDHIPAFSHNDNGLNDSNPPPLARPTMLESRPTMLETAKQRSIAIKRSPTYREGSMPEVQERPVVISKVPRIAAPPKLQTVRNYHERPRLLLSEKASDHSKETSNKDDELDIFGKLIAAQLRGLSKKSRIQTQRTICNILFEAMSADLTAQSPPRETSNGGEMLPTVHPSASFRYEIDMPPQTLHRN